MNIIETLEREEIARLNKTIPDFAPGDTVIVNVNVVEGERKRVQAYEGVVIAKRNRGLNFGVHRPQDFERRRRRAHVPDVFAADRVDRSEAQGRRPPRETLLFARALRQVGADPRKAHGARNRQRSNSAFAAFGPEPRRLPARGTDRRPFVAACFVARAGVRTPAQGATGTVRHMARNLHPATPDDGTSDRVPVASMPALADYSNGI